jgi:hypothetical protein
MVRVVLLSAIAAFLMAVPARAGSPQFTISLYICSDVYVGGKKVSDNCLKSDEEKLEDMESMEEDPEDDDD